MNRGATPLLPDRRIYTMSLSQQFYTEGKSSSIRYIFRAETYSEP